MFVFEQFFDGIPCELEQLPADAVGDAECGVDALPVGLATVSSAYGIRYARVMATP